MKSPISFLSPECLDPPVEFHLVKMWMSGSAPAAPKEDESPARAANILCRGAEEGVSQLITKALVTAEGALWMCLSLPSLHLPCSAAGPKSATGLELS